MNKKTDELNAAMARKNLQTTPSEAKPAGGSAPTAEPAPTPAEAQTAASDPAATSKGVLQAAAVTEPEFKLFVLANFKNGPAKVFRGRETDESLSDGVGGRLLADQYDGGAIILPFWQGVRADDVEVDPAFDELCSDMLVFETPILVDGNSNLAMDLEAAYAKAVAAKNAPVAPSPAEKYLDRAVDTEALRIQLVRFPALNRTIPDHEFICSGWIEAVDKLAPDPAPVIKLKKHVPYFMACTLREADLVGETLKWAEKTGRSTFGKQRSGAHVESLTSMILLDDDGDVFAREPLLRKLGVAAAIFTSHSYGFIKDGSETPALGGRVAIPLDRSMAPAEYGFVWDAINHLLGGGFDKSGRSAALCYGQHARRSTEAPYRRVVIDGAALNVDALITLGRSLAGGQQTTTAPTPKADLFDPAAFSGKPADAFAGIKTDESLGDGLGEFPWYPRLPSEQQAEVILESYGAIAANTKFFELTADGGDYDKYWRLTTAGAVSGVPEAEEYWLRYALAAKHPASEAELREYFNQCKDSADGRLKVDHLLEMARDAGTDFSRWILQDAQAALDARAAKAATMERVSLNLSTQPLPARLMQTSAEFVKNYIPPEYLIDGFLQRRFLYSFTAPTGSGKTAAVLLIAMHVARGIPLAGMEVEKGRVLIFVGENPDDVRSRWIKLCEVHDFDPDSVDVVFMPFTVKLSAETIRKQINDEAAEHGPFSLLIVDTSAAYYSGDDENDNVALGKHAALLRTFIELPGGPTVLVTCHPTKNPDMANLLPRGGGAFLAAVDGNLVGIKNPTTMTIEITTHGKFRGPEFAPFSFRLIPGQSVKLVDVKGRKIWTVHAEEISTEEQEALEQQGLENQNDLLRLILDFPEESMSSWAERLGWETGDGRPNKSRVQRALKSLTKAKLVEQVRESGPYTLTKRGNATVQQVSGQFTPTKEAKPKDAQEEFPERLNLTDKEETAFLRRQQMEDRKSGKVKRTKTGSSWYATVRGGLLAHNGKPKWFRTAAAAQVALDQFITDNGKWEIIIENKLSDEAIAELERNYQREYEASLSSAGQSSKEERAEAEEALTEIKRDLENEGDTDQTVHTDTVPIKERT